MKKIFLVTVVMLSVLLNAQGVDNNTSNQSNNSIVGGFGLKLGDVFDIKSAIGSSETISGEKLYEVKPSKKIKYFKKYYVLITPKTHKIRQIWGIGSYKNKPSCEKDLGVLEVMLEKKYGKFTEPSFSMDKAKWVTDNMNKERDIIIKCNGFMDPISFYIIYKDAELNELSKKEEAEIEAEKIDSSAL